MGDMSGALGCHAQEQVTNRCCSCDAPPVPNLILTLACQVQMEEDLPAGARGSCLEVIRQAFGVTRP